MSNLQGPIPPDIMAQLDKIAEDCNKEENQKDPDVCPPPPSGEKCTTLGTKKHKCCENKIKGPPPLDPSVKSEVAYTKKGNLVPAKAEVAARQNANQAYESAKSSGQSTKGVWAASFFGSSDVHLKADVVVVKDPNAPPTKDNILGVTDFKFNCGEKGKMSAAQKTKYNRTLGVPEDVPLIHKDGSTC